MNIEFVRVVYSPSQERKQAGQETISAEAHVDDAVEVIGNNAAEKQARVMAQEEARREMEMAQYAESIEAHEFNMGRVMDLLNDPALAEMD